MSAVSPPFALLAELTHRCPLQCVYCSNPIELVERNSELATQDWQRVLSEAAALGVLQVHLSGGEPILRPDLVELVAHAATERLFTNVITSGLGLTPELASRLSEAGLNGVQLSVQGDDDATSARVARIPAVERKRRAAAVIREEGLPLSMNVVLHRMNVDRLDQIIDLCVEWGAERLELANTQFYGWALRNRDQLLPTRRQLEEAEAVYRRRREELADRLELLWIIPDYYEKYPKPCMGGWAATSFTVGPDGVAYPCPVATEITDLDFPSVREHGLRWIWNDSPAFNAYRGTDWMPEPCVSCVRRDVDFGGCRCQAFALTGDAARTDPVCVHSPDHHLIAQTLTTVEGAALMPAQHLDDLSYRRLTTRPST